MFARKSIIWQIFPQYILLILISLIIVTLYATDALKNIYLHRIRTDLKSRGRLIGRILTSDISAGEINTINREIEALAKENDIRISVILTDGKVIADSEEDYRFMENHADRPEIREAFETRVGSSIRYSVTLNKNMLYVAVPVIRNDEVIAFIRTSMPAADLSHALHEIYRKIAFTGILVIFIAGMIGLGYTYFLNKPIQAIKLGARRIGNGELNHRLYITKPIELKNLAESMNKMADQLEERIDIITQQRNELEAILTSMVEAVLVVDTEERIIRMNHAMSKLLDVNTKDATGKDIQTVFRNIALQRFIRETLNSRKPREEELIVTSETERTVQAHGTLLKDASENTIGGLIVLNDITRQKSLEDIRRQFVANVSHELKTPVTAIHGFVETLREGAIHDKKKAPEFLQIIMKHTDRLNTIIEDLLNLSRIEQDSEKGEISLKVTSVRQVMQEAVSLCLNKAAEKNIELTLQAKSGLKAKLNPPLLTQAVVNLIDNAIKYSPEGSSISIQALRQQDHLNIQVKDNGIGIPHTDIPRIFERFYRVDKARSRQLGGTGLGLSIVKHIIQAHGGTITVDSQPGEGSTFTLSITMI
ncbi:PAS domain-containing protein [bacterium]|nr:PAS domain-containing protein [bacterium]